MKPHKMDKCPYCGGKDIRQGYLDGGARMCGPERFLEDLCIIRNLICADCGSIILSWIDKPEMYPKSSKDRE